MRIARRLLLPSLTSKLSWIPFYEQSRIDKCSIIYKRINGTLPTYLNETMEQCPVRYTQGGLAALLKNNMISRVLRISNYCIILISRLYFKIHF